MSPYTGRILEVMADPGAIVGRGEPILTLDMSGRTVKGLEAIIYVPPSHGKQIRPGMPIQIAPTTVKQEEYGLMLGRVTYVSDFPSTSRGMRRVLKNDQLISGLTGNTAPYEVHADLIVDPTTVSQFRGLRRRGRQCTSRAARSPTRISRLRPPSDLDGAADSSRVRGL